MSLKLKGLLLGACLLCSFTARAYSHGPRLTIFQMGEAKIKKKKPEIMPDEKNVYKILSFTKIEPSEDFVQRHKMFLGPRNQGLEFQGGAKITAPTENAIIAFPSINKHAHIFLLNFEKQKNYNWD